MQTYTLAHVVFEQEQRAYDVPTLYYHTNVTVHITGERSVALMGAGTFDATTFMNAFSYQKWKTYTHTSDVWLHIELKGSAVDLIPTYAQEFDETPQTRSSKHHIEQSDAWQAVDISLDCSDNPVLLGFQLVTSGACELKNAYYYTHVEEADITPVELALCTTTFKKEPYIINNARRIRHSILESNEPIAQHLTMHIVDNGRTLGEEDVVCKGIYLYPNPNAGGSGGYARGMIEAKRQTPRATHVLLMDDDVEVCPESIIRTYTLLSIIKPRYSSAFISGAMMCLEDPGMRWEDVGHMLPNGQCLSLKSPNMMTLFSNVVRNEVMCNESDLTNIIETESQYAGWWYCVIPMQTIEEIGLPLPLFVRFDDIEYSLRAHCDFITMNGIAVWHMGFNTKYSAAVERYQTTRNSFITQATSNICSFESLLIRFKSLACELDLRKFNYTDAALALEGFEDFLKGPSFIMKKGQVEERFMYANRNCEKLLPKQDFKKALQEHGWDSIIQAYASPYLTNFEGSFDVHRSLKQRVIDYITFNGQRMRMFATNKPEPAVIDHAGWLYQPGVISQREHLIVINRFSGAGCIRTRDEKRFAELHKRLMSDLACFAKHKDELVRAYRDAFSTMTSDAFWLNYLGVDASEHEATDGDAPASAQDQHQAQPQQQAQHQ